MFNIFKAIKKDSSTRHGSKESDLHDFLRKGGENSEANKDRTLTNGTTENGHADIKSFRDAFRASEYGLVIRDLDKEKKELANSRLASTENTLTADEAETTEPQLLRGSDGLDTSGTVEKSVMQSRPSSGQRSDEGTDSDKPLPRTPGIGETERAPTADLEPHEVPEDVPKRQIDSYATGMEASEAGSVVPAGLTEGDIGDGQDWANKEANEDPITGVPPPGSNDAELDSSQQLRDEESTVLEQTEAMPVDTSINGDNDTGHSQGGLEDGTEWEPRNLDEESKPYTSIADPEIDTQPTPENPDGLQLDDSEVFDNAADQANAENRDLGEEDGFDMEGERGEDDQEYSEGEISDEPDAQYDEQNYSAMADDDQQAEEPLDGDSDIGDKDSRYEEDDQSQAFDEAPNEDDVLDREFSDYGLEEQNLDDTMQEDQSLQGDKVKEEEEDEEEEEEEGEGGQEGNEGLEEEEAGSEAAADLVAGEDQQEEEDLDERDEFLDEEGAFPGEEGQDDKDDNELSEDLEDLDEDRSDLASNAESQQDADETVPENPLSIPGRKWAEAHLEAFRIHVRPKSNIFDFLARKGVPNRERVSEVVAEALKLCLKDSTALRGKTHATVFKEAGSTPIGSFLAFLALTVQSTMNTSKHEKTAKTSDKKSEGEEPETASTPDEHDEWDDFDEMDDDESPRVQLEPLATEPVATMSGDDGNVRPKRLEVATNIMVVLFLQAILESSRALMSGPEKAYLEWTFIPQELKINSGLANCRDENDGALHEKKSKLTAAHDVKWEDVNPLEYISIGSQPMYSKHHYMDSDNVKAQQAAHMISMVCERLRSSDKELSEFDRTTFAITSCATSVSFSYAIFTNEYIKHYQLEEGLPSTLTPEMEETVITSEPELKVFESMPYDLSRWDEALEAGELALALVEFLQKNGPLLAPIEGDEDPSPESEDSLKREKSISRASSAFVNSGKRFPIKIRPQRPAVPAASYEDVEIKEEAESMLDDGPSIAMKEDEEKGRNEDADSEEMKIDEEIEKSGLDNAEALKEDEHADEEALEGAVKDGVLEIDDMGNDKSLDEQEGLDGENGEEGHPEGKDREDSTAEAEKEDLEDGMAESKSESIKAEEDKTDAEEELGERTAKDELAKDEIADDGMAEDGIIANELTEDELTEDELTNDDVVDHDGLDIVGEGVLEDGSAYNDADYPDSLSPSNAPETSYLDEGEEPLEQDDQASMYNEDQYTPNGLHDDDNPHRDAGDNEYFSGEDEYIFGEDDAEAGDIPDDVDHEPQSRIEEITDDGYLTEDNAEDEYLSGEDENADDVLGQGGINGGYTSGEDNAQHEYLSDGDQPEHQYLTEDGGYEHERDYISGDENDEQRYAFQDDDLDNGYASVVDGDEVTDESFVAGEEDVEDDYPPDEYNDKHGYLFGDDGEQDHRDNLSDDATEADIDERHNNERGLEPGDELEHPFRDDLSDDATQADITELDLASKEYFLDGASYATYHVEDPALDIKGDFDRDRVDQGRVEEIDSSDGYLSQKEGDDYSDDGYEGSLPGDGLSADSLYTRHKYDEAGEADGIDERRNLEGAYEELPDMALNNNSEAAVTTHLPTEAKDQFQGNKVPVDEFSALSSQHQDLPAQENNGDLPPHGDDIKELPDSHHENADIPNQAFPFGFQTHDQDADQDQDHYSHEEELEPQSLEYEDELDLPQHAPKATHLSIIPEEEDDDEDQRKDVDHSTATPAQSHHQEQEPEYDADDIIDREDGYADADVDAADGDDAYDATPEPQYGDPVEGYLFDPHSNRYYPLDENGQPYLPNEEDDGGEQEGEEERYLVDDHPEGEMEEEEEEQEAEGDNGAAAADSLGGKGAAYDAADYDGAGYGDAYGYDDDGYEHEYQQEVGYAGMQGHQAGQQMGGYHPANASARSGAIGAAASAA